MNMITIRMPIKYKGGSVLVAFIIPNSKTPAINIDEKNMPNNLTQIYDNEGLLKHNIAIRLFYQFRY